jgi:hypothetical protein
MYFADSFIGFGENGDAAVARSSGVVATLPA